MVRLTGTEAVVFTSAVGCDFSRTFAHLAFCASLILRREAAEIIRVGWFVPGDVPVPFNDSITKIARSKFSTRACACLRSARSSCNALFRFPIVPPPIRQREHCIGLEW